MKKGIFAAVMISFLIWGNAHAKTLGDFNNDGKLTIADAVGFVLILMGRNPASDVGQEYLLASECQGVQSDLVGAWEGPATENGVTYYTKVITFHSNGTWWVYWLKDEIHVENIAFGTYSLAGNNITINTVVDGGEYYAGRSETSAYTIIGDTLTVYDEQGNALDVLTRRNP